MEPIQGNVSIDAQNIMPIIKKWLYSDKDIFIREVVSNGCDAITKLRMVDSAAAQNCSIHVEVDKAARELRVLKGREIDVGRILQGAHTATSSSCLTSSMVSFA